MNISRRKFLKGGLGVLGVTLTAGEVLALSAQASPRSVSGNKILIVVQMAGGNDGINTVIPYTDDAYYKARPSIGIKAPDVLKITDKVGLHPAMTDFAELFKKGKLAILQSVGYPEPNRSHFRSIEIWQTAEPKKIKDSGWLGRYLDLATPMKSADLTFPAINVDPILPKTLSAQKTVVPSIDNIANFQFKADPRYASDRQVQIDTFNQIYKDYDSRRKYLSELRMVGLDTTKASDQLAALAKSYKSTAQYPNDGFGRGLKFIAQLITGGLNCSIYNITIGGFDTHANQPNAQQNLLRRLSQGLTALQSDLEAHDKDKDVLVMTFSEFGRRVAENGGRGTDHGTAEPMFILGSSVKGGLVGETPNLTDLKDGDIQYKTDFRCVYATFLDRWLGADSKQVLGDKYDILDIIRT